MIKQEAYRSHPFIERLLSVTGRTHFHPSGKSEPLMLILWKRGRSLQDDKAGSLSLTPLH